MTTQTIIVYAIAVLLVGYLLYKAFRRIAGRGKRPGCPGCGNTGCGGRIKKDEECRCDNDRT